MTTAWMVAHGDIAADGPAAAPAWACTGCLACQQACEHGNPVADVLLDTRDALMGRMGRAIGPAPARRVLTRFGHHAARTRQAARRVARDAGGVDQSRDAVLIGCGYLRGAPDEARSAVEVATQIAGRPVVVADSCCGLPLRLAGDRAAFARHATAMAESLSRFERVFVADPGCALTLSRRYQSEIGHGPRTRLVLLVDAAAQELSRRGHSARGAEETPGDVRWHDPCALGRGLGVYEAPRAVLSYALGRPPAEFDDSRETAACSGGGGLVPSTMPAVAAAIASSRIEAHCRVGGGRIVTGCAASLLTLRKRGRSAGVEVDDVLTWALRALRQ
jgi:Fe-S oxidoreductase